MSNSHNGKILPITNNINVCDADTLFCAHFDNHAISENGIYPTQGSVYTLRQDGKYGGAVAVEEGSNNLVVNGNFSNALSGWNNNQNVSSSVVSENNKQFAYVVSNQDTSTPGLLTQYFAASPSTQYTVSLYGYKSLNCSAARIYVSGTGGGQIAFASNLTNDPSRISLTFTTGATHTSIRVGVLMSGIQIGSWIKFTEVQVEQKSFSTSFVDGSRANGVLEYGQSVYNVPEGTFSCWAKTSIISATRYLFFQWDTTGAGVSHFGLNMSSGGAITFSYGGSSMTTGDTFNDGNWHHYAITWKDGTSQRYIYVDGELRQSTSIVVTMQNTGGRRDGIMPLGHRGWSYKDNWWNGLIDEVRWDSVAKEPEEILSWYLNQRPFYYPADYSVVV